MGRFQHSEQLKIQVELRALYLRFGICGLVSMDSVNWGLCNFVGFTIEKNPLVDLRISNSSCSRVNYIRRWSIIESYVRKREWKFLIFSFLSFFFLLFRAAPVAYSSSRTGVKLALQLPAYTTATATRDLSCICDPHYSSRECRILNPLSKAREWTCIFMDTSRVHNLLSHDGNSRERQLWFHIGMAGAVVQMQPTALNEGCVIYIL